MIEDLKDLPVKIHGIKLGLKVQLRRGHAQNLH